VSNLHIEPSSFQTTPLPQLLRVYVVSLNQGGGGCFWDWKETGERTGDAGRAEKTVLLEEPDALDAETIQEDEKTAKPEAERTRPGLTVFTDGSRLDSGAACYAVTWQRGQSWVGIKTHVGYNQEAYDTECAALARALEEAAGRQITPEMITIFTDAQAAIRRMASEDPGPGQMYAIQARRHIAALRKARPEITIDIRWSQSHPWKRESRRVGQARGIRTRRIRRRVAAGRGAPNATPQIPRTLQAGNLGEAVG
jgi:ribonuclease HI